MKDLAARHLRVLPLQDGLEDDTTTASGDNADVTSLVFLPSSRNVGNSTAYPVTLRAAIAMHGNSKTSATVTTQTRQESWTLYKQAFELFHAFATLDGRKGDLPQKTSLGTEYVVLAEDRSPPLDDAIVVRYFAALHELHPTTLVYKTVSQRYELKIGDGCVQ